MTPAVPPVHSSEPCQALPSPAAPLWPSKPSITVCPLPCVWTTQGAWGAAQCHSGVLGAGEGDTAPCKVWQRGATQPRWAAPPAHFSCSHVFARSGATAEVWRMSPGVIAGYTEQSEELKSYFHCTIKTCEGGGTADPGPGGEHLALAPPCTPWAVPRETQDRNHCWPSTPVPRWARETGRAAAFAHIALLGPGSCPGCAAAWVGALGQCPTRVVRCGDGLCLRGPLGLVCSEVPASSAPALRGPGAAVLASLWPLFTCSTHCL